VEKEKGPGHEREVLAPPARLGHLMIVPAAGWGGKDFILQGKHGAKKATDAQRTNLGKQKPRIEGQGNKSYHQPLNTGPPPECASTTTGHLQILAQKRGVPI